MIWSEASPAEFWILLLSSCIVVSFVSGFGVYHFTNWYLRKTELKTRREIEAQIREEDEIRKRRQLLDARRSYMPRDNAGRSAVVRQAYTTRRPRNS